MDLFAANIDRYIAERVRAAREAIASEPPAASVADDPMYADDIGKRPFVNLRGERFTAASASERSSTRSRRRISEPSAHATSSRCIETLDGQEHLCDGTLSEFVRIFLFELLRVRRDRVVNRSLIRKFRVLPRGCGEAKRTALGGRRST